MLAIRRLLAIGAVAVTVTSSANAQVAWDWSFGTNAGQFITDGTAPGGIAAPGEYTLSNFIVTASGDGATLGSWLGGEYSPSGFSTSTPYSFGWDGAAVTYWESAGINSFNWLVFLDVSTFAHFFFGWETSNINTVDHAAYYFATTTEPSYPLAVSVAGSVDTTVPEPATMTLLAVGMGGMAAARRRRRGS